MSLAPYFPITPPQQHTCTHAKNRKLETQSKNYASNEHQIPKACLRLWKQCTLKSKSPKPFSDTINQQVDLFQFAHTNPPPYSRVKITCQLLIQRTTLATKIFTNRVINSTRLFTNNHFCPIKDCRENPIWKSPLTNVKELVNIRRSI